MPRKPYWDQRKFNEGWTERKTLNRYRKACKRVSVTERWFPLRHWEGGAWSPRVTRKTWFVIRNPLLKPLLHKGTKHG